MVVWLLAGGGEAEVRGLDSFFAKHFRPCRFIRMAPVRRKLLSRRDGGPQAGYNTAYGSTGRALADEIRQRLPKALRFSDETCDLILVIDDLDCRDPDTQRRMFLEAIESAIKSVIESVPAATGIPGFVGFAAPELEAWIIADWDNAIAKDPDFRSRHQAMKHWLATRKQIDFDTPENFSNLSPERDTCEDKLSEAIIEATQQEGSSDKWYRKGFHSPEMLKDVNPETVASKCPQFRGLRSFLNTACQ